MKKIDFKDKVIWVTGASSGIGASLATQLNNLGATVIASARRRDRLIELQENCTNLQNFITLPLDITDSRSIENAVTQVRQLGRLDLILHNAGIAQKGLVIETELDVDRRIMETNYFGTVALTKAIMPMYLQQGYGGFGIVSSFAGVMGIPGRAAYSASKHALHGFFESLKAEHMACKLNISFILPGFINTAITAKGLCGDGTPYGKVETSHRLGMTARQCAQDIIKGLQKKRKQIAVGKFEVYLLSIHRIAPGLGHYIIKNHPMRRWRKLKSRLDFTIHFRGSKMVEGQVSKSME